MHRDTIFISHATPEDNEFTIWLASRLELLGYNVWIDKIKLIGGETFWKEIDQSIRNTTIKFLLVYSKNICYNQKPGDIKNGINNEIELAKSIAIENNFKDFIIPLKIDNSPHNLFVGANVLNHIDFSNEWSEGLKLLIKKLNEDLILPDKNKKSSIKDWYESDYITCNGIIPKNELYYSTWWAIDDMPNEIYMHRFENKKQADTIYFNNSSIPVGKIANVLTTFCSTLDNKVIDKTGESFYINPKETYSFKISEIILGFEKDNFPTHRDSENHLKKLLNRAFHLIMRKKGLFWYEMSSRSLSYFYPMNLLTKDQVYFEFPFKKTHRKRKKVLGKHKNLKWHYSISQMPKLTPVFGFSLKHHLIFTTDGFATLDDKKVMHSNRRAKGKRLFNEEWRDMMLAFIQGLKDESGEIFIQLGENKALKMKEYPEMFWAEFGYDEPNQKMELEEYYFEEDEY
jgi:hypothetical protein